MQYYEIATLRTQLFGAAKAAPGIQAFLAAPEAKGQLLGAWYSDIGALNEVYLLRGFENYEDLLAERDRVRLSDNPFGCVDVLVDLTMDSYKPLDFIAPVTPGKFGPVYEIRTYHTKLNGLAPTIEKWREAVPARTELSSLTVAMYSIDGGPRFTQIWPYASANERAEVRAKSVADGVWPPKGGPDWLAEDMTSTLAMPLPFSPLQ
ncbi:MAG: NIPSNAP family protein [Pontibacterium sp.]